MVGPGELRGGVAALLADASFAAVTARDCDRRLWIFPVTGPPGFTSTLRMPAAAKDFPIRRGVDMATDDIELTRSADTFFLGTTHPERGNDASHRGGSAAFVYANRTTVEWPDYPGNNMFNSLGNLAVDPTAALLFIDFRSGRTLQQSGSAHVVWDTPAAEGETGRRVRISPERVVARRLVGIRAVPTADYRYHSQVSRGSPHIAAAVHVVAVRAPAARAATASALNVRLGPWSWGWLLNVYVWISVYMGTAGSSCHINSLEHSDALTVAPWDVQI